MYNYRFLLLTTFFPLLVWAQPAKTDTATLFKAFDKIVKSNKFKDNEPGFAVMVVKEGQVLYQRQRGMADVDQKRPIKPDDVFHIGSTSKQFAATCAYLLEEQGKLSLNDSIQRFLPEIPWLGHTVRIRHLVGHTSGIPDHFETALLRGKLKNKALLPDYALREVARYPILTFEPGTQFAYCNTAYMLLAIIVERASGMTLTQYANQHIFGPLGMKNTSFRLHEGDIPVKQYTRDGKGKVKKHRVMPNAPGAVGVYTTLPDLFLWDQNFYKNKLGKGDSTLLERMQRSDTLLNGNKTNYGAGLFLAPYRRWEQTVSHPGGWGGFQADYRRFPNSEITIMAVSNADFVLPFIIADTLSDIILKYKAYKFKHQPIEGGVGPDAFCGTFIGNNNIAHKVLNINGNLGIQALRPGNTPAKPLELFFISKREDGRYSFWDEKGEKVFFVMDEKGTTAIGLNWEGGHFMKIQNQYYAKIPPVATNAADWKKWEGRYRSPLHKQRLRVKYSKKEKGLVIKPSPFHTYPLECLGGNVFRVKGEPVVLRFEQAPSPSAQSPAAVGRIRMTLGNDWVRGIPFEKR
jgi:CubicO group peptidase (beta-lactamase class C family)